MEEFDAKRLEEHLNRLAGENMDKLSDPEIVKLSQEVDIIKVKQQRELNERKGC